MGARRASPVPAAPGDTAILRPGSQVPRTLHRGSPGSNCPRPRVNRAAMGALQRIATNFTPGLACRDQVAGSCVGWGLALPEPFAERLQGQASYNVYMVRSAFIAVWQVPVLPASAFLYAAGAERFRHYLRAASFQPPGPTNFDRRKHRSLGLSRSCPAGLEVRSRPPRGRGPVRAVPASALRS